MTAPTTPILINPRRPKGAKGVTGLARIVRWRNESYGRLSGMLALTLAVLADHASAPRPMVTAAEMRVIQRASKGFLARCFGTADHGEIASRLKRIAEGMELPLERLWEWAQGEVRVEEKRR